MDTRIGEIVFAFNEAGSTAGEALVLAGARKAGYTLVQLGELFGVTRERIRQRVANVPDGSELPVFPTSAKKLARDAKAAKKLADQLAIRDASRRILGLRKDSPAMNVPVATLNEIHRLGELVTTVRGWTPLDAPARLAIKPYGDLLYETITNYSIPQKHLELPLGKAGGTFTVWLRNHGYLKQMPSQKSYKGVLLKPAGRGKGTRTLVVGSTCKGGHVMTEDSIVPNGTTGNVTCRLCRNERRAKHYQRKKAQMTAR